MPYASTPLAEAWQFLYPEEGPGGVQREVWQNPTTGAYEYRNESYLPGYDPNVYEGPRATGDELLGLRQLQEQRYPDLPRIAEQPAPYSPAPAPSEPSWIENFLFNPVGEYAQATGIPALAQGLIEPFQVARAGGPQFYGQDLGPIAQFLTTAQEAPPVLNTAPFAAEQLFAAALGDLGRFAPNILRSSEAFNKVSMGARTLATSEQGAIPFMKLVPEPTDTTIDAARRVLSNLPSFGVSELEDAAKSRAFQALNSGAPPGDALLAAGRELAQSLPSGKPSFFAGDEYSLARQAARKEGLPAINIGGRTISTLQEVFHGTASPANFAKLEPQAGRPIFVSNSPWYAGNYMGVTSGSRADLGLSSSGDPRMIKAFIKPNAKVIDDFDLPDELQQLGAGTDETALLDWMKSNGVDAVRFGNGKEMAVSNADALLYDEYIAPTMKALFSDEGGFLNFGKQNRLSPQTQQALGGAKSLTWGDITRTVQDATTNRIAGIERSARRLGGDELNALVDEFNQVGSVVTKAAERSRMVYEGVANVAARAGVRTADMPSFQEDVNKYLYAQTAATWRKLHPRAADRPFGSFTSSKEAAQWLASNANTPGQTDIEAAARIVANDHARLRDALYQAGGLTKAAYTELTANYPWYNPLKYTNIANDAALGNADALNTLGSLRAKIRELANDVPTHGNVVSPMEATFLANNATERFIANNNFVRRSLDVMRRDPDMQGSIRKLQPRQTHNTDTERAVVLFNNGGVERWAMPKWAAGEIEHTIAHDGDNAIINALNTLNKIWRTGAIEQNPAFIATNFVLDHLNAYIRAGTVPGTAVGEMVRYLRGQNTDPLLRAFRLAGAEQSKFFSNATQGEKLKLARSLQSEANRNLDLANPESIKRRIISFLPNMGRATEQGQRLKAFENSMDKLLPGWKTMSPVDVAATPAAKRAATDALEAIINYHRGGWLTRNLDRIVPFANVAVQGTLLPLRIAQSPQGRRRLAALGTTMTGLTWYNNSYPENADVPAYIRYGTIYVMLPTNEYTADGKPKPNYVVLSPALRDLVPFQGTMASLIEGFVAQSPTAGHGLMAQILANLPTGVGPGPALDLAAIISANYNMFREQPVVPESEQNLPPELQYGIATPRTYKELGSLLNMSPRTLQAVIESAGTGPAKTVAGTSDWILDTFFPEAVDQQVAQAVERINQMPPETRESLLTMLPSTLREQVEREALKREPSLPVVGAVGRRFNPEVGGELERVFPRDEATRIGDMNEALGVDTIRTLRELGKGPPLMNETFSYEGHYTKLSDRQLAAAHNIYRDYLTVTLAPMLADPMFQQLKSTNYAAAEKLISKFLEQTEKKIKTGVLSPQQRNDLRMQ